MCKLLSITFILFIIPYLKFNFFKILRTLINALANSQKFHQLSPMLNRLVISNSEQLIPDPLHRASSHHLGFLTITAMGAQMITKLLRWGYYRLTCGTSAIFLKELFSF